MIMTLSSNSIERKEYPAPIRTKHSYGFFLSIDELDKDLTKIVGLSVLPSYNVYDPIAFFDDNYPFKIPKSNWNFDISSVCVRIYYKYFSEKRNTLKHS